MFSNSFVRHSRANSEVDPVDQEKLLQKRSTTMNLDRKVQESKLEERLKLEDKQQKIKPKPIFEDSPLPPGGE